MSKKTLQIDSSLAPEASSISSIYRSILLSIDFVKNCSFEERFLQIFDSKKSIPDGTVPKLSFLIPGNTEIFNFNPPFFLNGLIFKNGIIWASSSQQDILKITTNDLVVQLAYKVL